MCKGNRIIKGMNEHELYDKNSYGNELVIILSLHDNYGIQYILIFMVFYQN